MKLRGMDKRDRVWFMATVVISCMMLYVIGKNSLHALHILGEITTLESQVKDYSERIERDSTALEEIKYDDLLEKYAREQYHMQREGEDIYIIE